MPHSSDNSEQRASFRAVCFTVLRPISVADTADTDTALPSPFGEDAGRASDGDSESGDGADERRSIAPGRTIRIRTL